MFWKVKLIQEMIQEMIHEIKVRHMLNSAVTQKEILITIALTKFSESLQENCFWLLVYKCM